MGERREATSTKGEIWAIATLPKDAAPSTNVASDNRIELMGGCLASGG